MQTSLIRMESTEQLLRSGADGAALRYEAQPVLFASRPSRMALLSLSLPPSPTRPVAVNVWRNHAIEPLLPLLEPYCSFGGWNPRFNIGGYDDTLTFAGHQQADLELLWLDSDRLRAATTFSELVAWLENRLHALRAVTDAPIVLATWARTRDEATVLSALADAIPASYFADLEAVCAEAGVDLLDSRSAAMAGTPLARNAQFLLARKLACHWMPAACFTPLKAIALDLDHTLHEGVLGEDGILGVRLHPGHIALQRSVKNLQASGIFVALVSRNELSDVEALFAQRPDYPLRWDDFSAVEISWGSKSSALERIAAALRIAPDSILLVDDNPGELAEIALRLPQMPAILAQSDPELTQRTIEYYPGIWRWRIGRDDSKRIEDLKANASRNAVAQQTGSPEEYLRSLRIVLVCRYDPHEQLNRIADLSQKTNQFNLAMRRFKAAEIDRRIAEPDTCVATVQLSDRFSDSGVIAIVIARRDNQRLVIEELCISCRALGRQLEDTIVFLAIRQMEIFDGCREVTFAVRHGPRNQPALAWLARHLQRSEPPEPGDHTLPAEYLADFVPPHAITMEKDRTTVHGSPAD